MRRRRSALRRRYGHAKIPRVGGTDPNRMSAAAINRELDKLDKIRNKLDDEMIATGRGHETWSETVSKNPATSDDLTIAYQVVSARAGDLRRQVERRAGPGMKRLPKGFGPIGQW